MNISRTVIALLLTLLTIAIPCTEWYIVGNRDVSKETALLKEQQLQKAQDIAKLYAGNLNEKLVAIRNIESRRPFYHYQNAYYRYKDAPLESSSIPSPLLHDPLDSLIEGYFVIDPGGGFKYTTRKERRFHKLSESKGDSVLWADDLSKELQSIIIFSKNLTVSFLNNLTSLDEKAREFRVLLRNMGPRGRIEIIDQKEWEENLRVGEFSMSMPKEEEKRWSVLYESFPHSKIKRKQGQYVVFVTPFNVHNVILGNEPGAVSIRSVNTPQGMIVQGFVISCKNLQRLLIEASFPTQLVFRKPKTDAALAPLGGMGGWFVSVDPTQALLDAENMVQQIHSRFQTVFFVGLLVTVLAGFCVVGLVWQLDRLARQRAKFAASAAHELKTPLAGLRMYGEMLAEGLGDASKTKSYARRIADEAERLGRVVTNVLNFSGLERGSLTVDPRKGDLGETVRECFERQKTLLETEGAVFVLSIPEDLPQVLFDPDAVFHILQNLLDNAEKYSRQSSNRNIRIILEKVEKGVCLSVIDHGPGIPASVQKSIFRPFARGGEKQELEGLGLGLSLAQNLAKAQHTKVIYRDNPDGGAVFSITFFRERLKNS